MQRIRLILVDDESDFTRTLSKRLTKRGFSPIAVGGVAECLRMLAEAPADVIVSDVKMPGADGIDLVRTVRRSFPHTEIILLTGQSSAQDGVAGIKAGAFDYLSKPVELDHLIRKINQAGEAVQRAAEKETESKLRAEMAQQVVANRRLASLGTLAAGVAHEINNPLAIINDAAGWLRSLLTKEENASIYRHLEMEQALDKIDTAVGRARRITHELLGGVRKTNGALSDIDISVLIDEATRLVKKQTPIGGARIETNCRSMSKLLRSDSHQLRQVLINLIINGMHATGPNGCVSVRCGTTDTRLIITISDDGPGVPADIREMVFEPFFSTKPPGEGTGLGLYISKTIVERLKGELTVESEVGKGSHFIISLPYNI